MQRILSNHNFNCLDEIRQRFVLQWNYQVVEDELGEPFSTHGRDEKCVQEFGRKT
jgi:hypothetical protein